MKNTCVCRMCFSVNFLLICKTANHLTWLHSGYSVHVWHRSGNSWRQAWCNTIGWGIQHTFWISLKTLDRINKKYVSSMWPSFQTISSCKNHCCSFSLTYLTGDLSMDALDVGVGVIVLHWHKSGPPHLDTHGPWQFAEDIGQLFSLRCTALSIEDGPVVQRDLGRTWNVLIQQYYPPPTKLLLETAHIQSYIFM